MIRWLSARLRQLIPGSVGDTLGVMIRWLWLIFFVALVFSDRCGFAAPSPDPLAIFQRECVSCHTEAKRKGGLLIDSRESLLKGGDTGPAIVPGKANESYLVETLFPDAESHMPPKGQLDPREIEALETWIDEGAPWDAEQWASLNLPEKRKVNLVELPARYTPILALAISPDGSKLVVGRGGYLDWYEVEKNQEKPDSLIVRWTQRVNAHKDAVQSLTFSPDGTKLVSGGFRTVRWWNVAKPETMTSEQSEPFLGRITALLYIEDGKALIVADSIPSQAGRLHVVSTSGGETVSFDSAHLDSIFALALSPDGKRYATASGDKLVTIRSTQSHEILMRLEGHTGYAMTAVFSPEGNRIATAGDDEEIKVWSLETGKKTGSFGSKRSGPLYGLAWEHDFENQKKKSEEKDPDKAKQINTDRIVAISESGRPASFTDLKEHEGEQRSTGAKERGFDEAKTPLYASVLHPESQWLIAGGENGQVFVWDAKGKRQQVLDAPERKTVEVASQ